MQIMSDNARFSLLFRKYIDGTALPEEKLEFFALADDSKWQGQLAQLIDAELVKEDSQSLLTAEEKDEILANIYKSTASEKEPVESETPRKVKLWPRIAVAAAAVAAIVFGIWFFNSRYDMNVEPGTEVTKVNDIAPGKNGATITLSNGKVIELSDAKTGVVIGDDLKYSDGSPLSPQGGSLPEGERSEALTASTAKGQTYQFTLPDGTKVWLNADSKLEFPSQFIGKERKILLEGEGYFEVSKDKAHPFIVTTDNQTIEVLGTHFNVNSYEDRGTVTSLLEGSVKLTNEVEGRILKPGERGISTVKGIMLVPGDVNDAVAWKNGYFRFRGEQIQTIMDQLARWYDIEVVYKGKMPTDGFNGKVSRNKNISQVLKALEAMKIVHFKVEGRRVTVID